MKQSKNTQPHWFLEGWGTQRFWAKHGCDKAGAWADGSQLVLWGHQSHHATAALPTVSQISSEKTLAEKHLHQRFGWTVMGDRPQTGCKISFTFHWRVSNTDDPLPLRGFWVQRHQRYLPLGFAFCVYKKTHSGVLLLFLFTQVTTHHVADGNYLCTLITTAQC